MVAQRLNRRIPAAAKVPPLGCLSRETLQTQTLPLQACACLPLHDDITASARSRSISATGSSLPSSECHEYGTPQLTSTHRVLGHR